MTIHLYNSLTRQKELLEPMVPGKIGMYVCGLTIYDHCHIGHGRMLTAFDVIVRHLMAEGFEVTFVRNITDIDDKIIQRANDNGESVSDVTDRYTLAMHEDCDALGLLRPTIEPTATGSIDEIIAMIRTLEEKGYAYQGSNGDVFFPVKRFAGYGELSGKQVDDLRVGARIEIDDAKNDPLDFVLWKLAKPGEPSWPSPWGHGRPGWHIECSAMSTQFLGNQFDIHGGGMDLKFPHHENEIAQSCAATGESFARYWLHNGFVQVDNEKMSKSLGNFFTIRDILKVFKAEELRLFLVSAHYRKPINYSDQELMQARTNLTRLYLALRGLPDAQPPGEETFTQRFRDAMNDDFNTPGALAVLYDLARQINVARKQDDLAAAAGLGALLRQLSGRLGLLQADPETQLRGEAVGGPSDEKVEALVAQRLQAKADRDWTVADRIRDRLAEDGVVLEDRGMETRWRRQ
ncbi:MAG: cysteine--tRNA ligase [Gammaproteobacteria bacterium]|nr:cysteine--tRNA ligase [Gammaproteobacteria bacterium]